MSPRASPTAIGADGLALVVYGKVYSTQYSSVALGFGFSINFMSLLLQEIED